MSKVKCQPGSFLLETLGGSLFQACPPASGGRWQCCVFLALWPCQSSLPVVTWRAPCVSLHCYTFTWPSKDPGHWTGSHPNPA